MQTSTARWLVVLEAAVLLIGCGGTTSTGTSRQFDDASISSGGSADASSEGGSTTSTDAGTFACGPSRCSADELCVYRFVCGCAALTTPGGACPIGLQQFDDAGICFKQGECPDSSCMTWQDAVAANLWCDGRGSLSGSIKGPIPPRSSHVCLNACVPP